MSEREATPEEKTVVIEAIGEEVRRIARGGQIRVVESRLTDHVVRVRLGVEDVPALVQALAQPLGGAPPPSPAPAESEAVRREREACDAVAAEERFHVRRAALCFAMVWFVFLVIGLAVAFHGARP